MVRREAPLSLVADGSVFIGWYIWGIYASMVWGELLNLLGSAVGGVECGCLVTVFALFQSYLGEVLVCRMAEQDDDYLFEGFSRSDKIWVKEEQFVDLAWKEHLPALKELLARVPPRDQGDIDRERAMVEKQGRLDDIIERMSWEKMSIEEMEERILKLKRDVAEIDDIFTLDTKCMFSK